uniref:F-box domain-containing protein n=1 Tax=Opuntia streptacantha TaxID=393608 RepID=A0A7C8ZZ35_OPUST
MKSRKMLPCNVDLPIDVVAELLARLPVQTMLNFRCICTWTKLFTVVECTIPDIICFKKNSQFIFGTRERGIRLCNIETQHMKHLMKGHLFFSTDFAYYGTLYKESLVFFKNEGRKLGCNEL